MCPHLALLTQCYPHCAFETRYVENYLPLKHSHPKGSERTGKHPKGPERTRKDSKGSERTRKDPKGPERTRKDTKGPERTRKRPKGSSDCTRTERTGGAIRQFGPAYSEAFYRQPIWAQTLIPPNLVEAHFQKSDELKEQLSLPGIPGNSAVSQSCSFGTPNVLSESRAPFGVLSPFGLRSSSVRARLLILSVLPVSLAPFGIFSSVRAPLGLRSCIV